MTKAIERFREKRIVVHGISGELAIAELKIWEIPKSSDYPGGIKFSLFLVDSSGDVLVGLDNHRPKGPHLHLGNQELPYAFEHEEQLRADFWDLARKAGYQV